MQGLGQRIRRWRKWARLTQEQASRRCNVSISAWSQWESGLCNPTASHLEQIAAACGIDLERFFGKLPRLATRSGEAA